MWNLLFNIMESGNKIFKFDAFGATRLRLIWCYLFYNLEQDIHSFILYKKEKLYYNMHFILDVLDDQLGSKRIKSLIFCYVSPRNPIHGFHLSLPFMTFDYIVM